MTRGGVRPVGRPRRKRIDYEEEEEAVHNQYIKCVPL